MIDIKYEIDKILNTKKLDVPTKLKRILGRKGLFKAAYAELGKLKPDLKAERGAELNQLRKQVEQLLKTDTNNRIDFHQIDLSLPSTEPDIGASHPINQAMDQMVDIFSKLGFAVFTGPEIVSDNNNFGLLNFSPDHPARDTQDSFSLIDSDLMLRTQTSATQVPLMKKLDPPMRVIVPGKTFRREADATHMPMFHQLEGFIVDEQVRFTDLKGILTEFTKLFFGTELKMRFRPHFFPFTEPSAEVDIWWQREPGNGRWLEILGCGMIHPIVLENAGINSRKYQGIAFGLGLERPFMLRHQVNDMRLLYQNNTDFIKFFT